MACIIPYLHGSPLPVLSLVCGNDGEAKRVNKINKIWALWPEFLILLLCSVFLMFGIAAKKGYHGDEMLSFELANAQFNPWIVPTQPQGRLAKFVEQEIQEDTLFGTISNLWDTAADLAKNRGNSKLLTYVADVYPEPVWIDREAFVKYATVDKKDCFNYLSVYFNVKDDNHPPLFFMALHTVSSLFQNHMNVWMGCCLNLLFVLGTMGILMVLGRQCMTVAGFSMQGRMVGVGAAFIYGLSAGALSTVLLIRMYAMLSFFCVLLLAIHLRKLYHEELGTAGFERNNKGLILTTVLGFWTQYFFLFYCLPLAAITAISLWKKGRKKELIRYVISMITAAAIGLVIFPFAISDVFSSGRGVEALANLSAGLSGYGERVGSFLFILGMGCGMICILCLLLIWMSNGIRKKNERENLRKNRELNFVLLIPVVIYFFLAARMSPYMVDRYIMPLFPLVILVLCVGAGRCLAGWFMAKEPKQLRKVLILSFGLLACSQLLMPGHGDNAYLYPEYETQLDVAEEYRDLPCICISQGYEYYQDLPEFMQYDKTLLLTLEQLKSRQETTSITQSDKTVVLVKGNRHLQEVVVAMERFDFYPEKTIFSSNLNGGDVVLLFKRLD